jgi:LCP family protein required for cell wall assembly
LLDRLPPLKGNRSPEPSLATSPGRIQAGIQSIGPIFILFLLLSACGAAATAAPAPTQTAFVLVTVPPDATSTPTPFQPLTNAAPPSPLPLLSTSTAIPPSTTSSATPQAPTPTPAENATTAGYDPNALLPGTWTPPDISGSGQVPPAQILTDNQTVTFALLGSDTRGGTSFRTDTIVIAAVRPTSGQVSLISLPRDLWVYIPTVGMNRVNTAYEYGNLTNYPGAGPQLLKDTILYNLGIRIDHVAMIDFDGFRQVVNTLGGIDVPVVCPYTDYHLISPTADDQNPNNWSLFTVGPGVVHMDGDLALWYARARDNSSDFDRGRRSQEVLRSLYAQALKSNAVAKIPTLYANLSSTVTTDLGLSDLIKFAPMALHLTNASIRSYYINRQQVTPFTTAAGAAVLLPNAPAIQAVLQQALSASPRLPQTSALTIEIRNGTANPGWDVLAAQRLNYAGYNTRLSPADRTNYSGSLLYSLSVQDNPSQDASLLAVLGLPSSALVIAPMQSDVPYVLIVGADYQPCFNPVNMTP